jgi:hypothetical protein
MDPKGRINDIEKNIYLPVLLIPSLNKNSCILSYPVMHTNALMFLYSIKNNRLLDIFIFHKK